jgi:hypothetical protein
VGQYDCTNHNARICVARQDDAEAQSLFVIYDISGILPIRHGTPVYARGENRSILCQGRRGTLCIDVSQGDAFGAVRGQPSQCTQDIAGTRVKTGRKDRSSTMLP